MNLMDKSAAKNMSGPTSCHLQMSHCDRYPALSTPEQVKMWRSGGSLKVLCDDNNVPPWQFLSVTAPRRGAGLTPTRVKQPGLSQLVSERRPKDLAAWHAPAKML